MNEYRKRCISNTFKEIIFNDKAILEEWKKTSEFKKRMKLISNTKSYNKLVTEEENRQIWKINAFGNIY
jgi:L-amino acid N-acyltransferase YncA